MVVIVIDYFKELFTIYSIKSCDHVLSGIQPCILKSMNDELSVVFKEEELLEAVKTKTVVNRFRKVLDVHIDEAQGVLVLGRQTTDDILISYELLHTFKKRKHGSHGSFALKLYMSKAYDRVE
ncbi:reverse transcriptase [Gossypium australe]|uniref:Reverse transcriptase n=1 Tax=Gossypium australe TaxID=47621 RepID=A0A5B6WNA5_9ROSI|nr:reverse transcriptase [Gossypium australe]